MYTIEKDYSLEELEDPKGVIRIRKSKKNNYKTMVKRGTIKHHIFKIKKFFLPSLD